MLWRSTIDLEVTGYSANHIDTWITLDEGNPSWRYTGYYGFPERHRRRDAWNMLRMLAAQSTMPWIIMGDFNDLLHQYEKQGRAPHPEWLLSGFRQAVFDCGLQDFPFSGHQYTWERSRGTSNMIEEKLDRILTNEAWLLMYEGAKATSIVCPYSDHIPLMLTPVMLTQARVRKRFCFDNLWLREDRCREIVTNSWERTMGLDVLVRVECLGQDIWRWGRSYNSDFQRKIDHCKAQLDALRTRRDDIGILDYARNEKEYLFLLEQQHYFWKQRAKEFWYKGGDTNSKYFHNSVKARRRRNKIRKLRNADGVWEEDQTAINDVMLDYFGN